MLSKGLNGMMGPLAGNETYLLVHCPSTLRLFGITLAASGNILSNHFLYRMECDCMAFLWYTQELTKGSEITKDKCLVGSLQDIWKRRTKTNQHRCA